MKSWTVFIRVRVYYATGKQYHWQLALSMTPLELRVESYELAIEIVEGIATTAILICKGIATTTHQ